MQFKVNGQPFPLCPAAAQTPSLMVYGLNCVATRQHCSGGTPCCTGVCSNSGYCELEPGQPCSQPLQCSSGACNLEESACQCGTAGQTCVTSADCCANQCNTTLGECCNSSGTACQVPADCCTGLSCTGNPLKCQ
jgi:hypothetical protein